MKTQDNHCSILTRATSVYCFLRTCSLILQISPFELEQFLCALEKSKCSTNNLLSEIHVCIIRAFFACAKRSPTYPLDIHLINNINWPLYALALINNLNKSPKKTSVHLQWAIEALTEVQNGTNYCSLDARFKTSILEHLTENLMTDIKEFSVLFESRMEVCSRMNYDDRDTVPWLKKGDDGYPEICVLCGVGGDLLCCEYCSGTYHANCMTLSKDDYRGYWECRECAIPDPCRGLSTLEWYSLSDSNPRDARVYIDDSDCDSYGEEEERITKRVKEYTVVGRYVLEKSDEGVPVVMSTADVLRLLTSLNAKQWKQAPWKYWLKEWNRYLYVISELEAGDVNITTNGAIASSSNNNHNNNSSNGNNVFNSVNYTEITEIETRVSKRALGASSADSKQEEKSKSGVKTSVRLKSFDHSKFPKFSFKEIVNQLSEMNINLNNNPWNENEKERMHYNKQSESYVNIYSRNHEQPYLRLISPLPSAFLEGYDQKSGVCELIMQTLAKWYFSFCGYFTVSKGDEWQPDSYIHRLLCLSWAVRDAVSGKKKAALLKKVCLLLLEFEEQIPPEAMSAYWFMSPIEVNNQLCNLRFKPTELVDKKQLLQSTIRSKVSFLRSHRLIKLNGKFSKLELNESEEREDPDLEPELPPQGQADEEMIEGQENGSESAPEQSINLKEQQTAKHDSINRVFTIRGNLLKLPREALRRAARSGGNILLPHVNYPVLSKDGEFGSGMLCWDWRRRVKLCRSSCELVVLVQTLEKHLDFDLLAVFPSVLASDVDNAAVSDVDGRICAKTIEMNPVSSNLLLGTDHDIAFNSLTSVRSLAPLVVVSRGANAQSIPTPIRLSTLRAAGLRTWLDSLMLNKNKKDHFFFIEQFCERLVSILSTGICIPDWSKTSLADLTIFADSSVCILKERHDFHNQLFAAVIHLSHWKFAPNKIFFCELIIDKIILAAVVKASQIIQNNSAATTLETSSQLDLRASYLRFVSGERLSGLRYQCLLDSFYHAVPRSPENPGNGKLTNKVIRKVIKSSVNFETSKIIDRSIVASVSRENAENSKYYLPQVGDAVVYFVAGHNDYLTQYPDVTRGSTSSGGVDRKGLTRMKQVPEALPCTVVTIDYEFPTITSKQTDTGVLMILQLAITNTPNHRIRLFARENPTFFVLLRPGHSGVEFLVLRSALEFSISRQWVAGNLFQMLYDNGEMYQGKIVEISVGVEMGLPKWGGVGILWGQNEGGEDGVGGGVNVDYLNEWELEHIGNSDSRITNELKEAHENYYSYINKKLVGIVEKVLSMEEFHVFAEEVDGELNPDYFCYIPLCVHLKLLLERSVSNYYRQPVGLLGDIRSLYHNACYFNEDNSVIALQAVKLYRTIFQLLLQSFPEISTEMHLYVAFDACLSEVTSLVSLLFNPRAFTNFN